jgi:hypothetical protein
MYLESHSAHLRLLPLGKIELARLWRPWKTNALEPEF